MENKKLTLDYIKLTPQLIDTINTLQTGGTMHFSTAPEEACFDNSSLKDRIDEITELTDFLVFVYDNDNSQFSENQFARLLCNLRYLKTILNGFAAPLPEKHQK